MIINVNEKNELLNFYKKIGVNYIENNIIKHTPWFNAKNYYKKNQKEFEDLIFKYGSAIKNRYKPELFIQESKIEGYGLWTKHGLKKGDYIGQYIGVQNFANPFSKKTDYSYLVPAPTFPKIEINSLNFGNELRFVNHSWTPNLCSDHLFFENNWIIFFYASEDILPNTELTFDYGDDYFVTSKREVIISEKEFLKLIPAEKIMNNN